MTGVEAVPENIDFPKTEAEILKFWKEIDAFQTSLKQSKGKPQYTFYDGPPFATGKPHYGHLLAGTIKVKNNAFLTDQNEIFFELTD